MSWVDARAQAKERLAQLPLPPGDLTGLNVTLTNYADQATFRFHHGDRASLNWHRMCNCALTRLLSSRKATVTEQLITMDHVFHWTNQPTTMKEDYEPSRNQQSPTHCGSDTAGVETKKENQ